jgi:hypothetical protein
MRIEPSLYTESGLYLIFPDGETLALTRDAIERKTRSLLDDPESIPQRVRAATGYAPCEICPKRHTAEICHSIMPTLPFFDQVDRYLSYDRVTAVYRDAASSLLYVSETTLQDALKYITMLSLLQYCEVGRSYRAYFREVIPLMGSREMAEIIFKNIFLACGGRMEEVGEIIHRMRGELTHTTRCQLRRLRLISKGDAFCNAFVNTHAATEFLFHELQDRLKQESLVPVN